MARQKRFHPIRTLFVIVILAIAVYFGVMVYSGVQIGMAVLDATNSYETCRAQIDEGDYDGAVESVHKMTEASHRARTEVSQPQWTIARNLPVIGDDAENLCTLSEVVDDISLKVVDPLVTTYDTAAAGNYAGLLSIATSEGGIPGYFGEASSVVTQGNARLESLPPSHFPQINDLVARAKEMTGTASDAVETVNETVSAVEGVGSFLGDIGSSIGELGSNILGGNS